MLLRGEPVITGELYSWEGIRKKCLDARLVLLIGRPAIHGSEFDLRPDQDDLRCDLDEFVRMPSV